MILQVICVPYLIPGIADFVLHDNTFNAIFLINEILFSMFNHLIILRVITEI